MSSKFVLLVISVTILVAVLLTDVEADNTGISFKLAVVVVFNDAI